MITQLLKHPALGEIPVGKIIMTGDTKSMEELPNFKDRMESGKLIFKRGGIKKLDLNKIVTFCDDS